MKGRAAKNKPAEKPVEKPIEKPLVLNELASHFKPLALNELITASRSFPISSRVDLQTALCYLLGETYAARQLGVHRMYNHATLTFSDLLNTQHDPVLIGPLQFEEIEIGEASPARCLRQGLWLCRSEKVSFAVLLSAREYYGRDGGSHVEIAVPAGEEGMELSRTLFKNLEKLISEGRSYRGKILSLEAHDRYGAMGAVKVHKLPSVARDEVILPDQTLRLLEQNVISFIKHRDGLKKLGMAGKKGLLFYGPPGTGKTHTINYLASQLPRHTTLLVTAEQVGLLDHYFQLARFLQPTMLVIEDVDLIARAREQMHGPCEESLLNKLLNEMDGLREDTATLFVLTTNRPEQLEAALASRPGRIDQAIEFPLPDEEGRRKLIRLYAHGLEISEDLVNTIARKTDRATPAFIKELMRRSAQYLLQTAEGARLSLKHVESALDELLFRGGSLNLKLLGITPER